MSRQFARRKTLVSVIISCLIASVLPLPASADVSLARVFGSHMVLQRDIDLPVWGYADAGEQITVTLGNHQAKTKANDLGQWKLTLPPLPAPGPVTMTVTGKNCITLDDILIGEVWLCSGQSNMEWRVGQAANSAQEIAQAKYPAIRLFEVRNTSSGLPVTDFPEPAGHYETWRICSPETIGSGFSACAYFFGRQLHQKLNIPIGLIDTTWGGTRIEPWTPPIGFASIQALADIANDVQTKNNAYAKAVPPAINALKTYLQNAQQSLDRNNPLISAPPGWPGHALNHQTAPTGLYNAMIHPLAPFAIRGAIWYQGESNCGEGMLYYEKMKALIGGWRKVWNQGDFSFYFAQLAPFKYNRGQDLPDIWQAQLAALAIPNTGMAVTTDLVDNIKDIHPINKQDVGKRLALWALAKDYGFSGLVYSGPLFKSMIVQGSTIRVHFDHVGPGLTTRDGKNPDYFEIAGPDKAFVKAHAKIDGDTILVSCKTVSQPVAVRFGYHEEAMPNLVNKAGLPASPFYAEK